MSVTSFALSGFIEDYMETEVTDVPDVIEEIRDEQSSPGKLVGALTSGLLVLRYMSRIDEPVGVTQVARDLNLNTSTCFNLLKTLVHERLVLFDAPTKSYGLALGFVELAKRTLERASFARMIRPHLLELAAQYSVTVTLWQQSESDRVILVDRIDTDRAIRVHMAIGQRLPMYLAALGRSMAANSTLSRTELRQKFSQLRWDNPPSFDEYYEDIEQVRQRGYAFDIDHYVKGVTTISASINAGFPIPQMAISTIGFTGQLSKSMIEDIGTELHRRTVEVGKMLSSEIGHAVPAKRRAER